MTLEYHSPALYLTTKRVEIDEEQATATTGMGLTESKSDLNLLNVEEEEEEAVGRGRRAPGRPAVDQGAGKAAKLPREAQKRHLCQQKKLGRDSLKQRKK